MQGFFTDDDLSKIVDKVWEASQSKILESVEASLAQEIRASAHSMLRKRVDAEVYKVANKVVEARVEEIKARATQLCDKALNDIPRLVQSALYNALSQDAYAYKGLRDTVLRSIADLLAPGKVYAVDDTAVPTVMVDD
jgi:hypothetical protein